MKRGKDANGAVTKSYLQNLHAIPRAAHRHPAPSVNLDGDVDLEPRTAESSTTPPGRGGKSAGRGGGATRGSRPTAVRRSGLHHQTLSIPEIGQTIHKGEDEYMRYGRRRWQRTAAMAQRGGRGGETGRGYGTERRGNLTICHFYGFTPFKFAVTNLPLKSRILNCDCLYITENLIFYLLNFGSLDMLQDSCKALNSNSSPPSPT